MLNAIFRSAKRVGTSVYGLASGASTVGGGILQWMGVTVIPPWLLWIVAIAVLICLAIKLDLELEKEKEQSFRPEPNMTLMEVLKRIRGKEDIFGKEHGESKEVLKVFDVIREKAANGVITVFGRKDWKAVPSEHLESLPRVPIPADFWYKHVLDWDVFTQDERGALAPMNDIVIGDYYDIWFERRQIDKVWPLQQAKLGVRNPLVRRING